MLTLFSSALDDIRRLLGMTDAQYAALVPNGEYDTESYAGALVTADGDEQTFADRLRARDEAEGWTRVR